MCVRWGSARSGSCLRHTGSTVKVSRNIGTSRWEATWPRSPFSQAAQPLRQKRSTSARRCCRISSGGPRAGSSDRSRRRRMRSDRSCSASDDRLFRIVVDYEHERTEGLTDADMIDAISAVYGTRLTRTSGRAARVVSRVEIESGSSVAKWGDAGHVVALYRTASYGDAFRLIVTDSALAALARKAEVRAARLDAQEAPSREIARQKKERDDGRAAAEKARVANKGAFRP